MYNIDEPQKYYAMRQKLYTKRRYYKCHLYKVLEQASLIEDDRNQNSVCLLGLVGIDNRRKSREL